MPEGDTIARLVGRLGPATAGRTVTSSEVRIGRGAGTSLVGQVLVGWESRGKHILTRFSGGLTLHTHLKMDGRWTLLPAGKVLPRRVDPDVRVIIGLGGPTLYGIALPIVELVPTREEATVVGHLGPDLLGPDWDLDEAVRRVSAQPERSIGEALLDQRNLAGIGTLYRSELLFLQGIHPRTPVARVRDVRRVLQRGQQLLHANRWRTEQSTTGDLRQGRSRYVFERPGQPCRRCRTPILTEEFGPRGQERRSYWCPRCQPAVEPAASGT